MTSKPENVKVGGHNLSLTNLDKVLFPGGRFTKAQVIDYYARVSEFILPHLKDRPITLKRYPDGVHGKFFYEKNAPGFTPSWVKRFPVPRHHRSGSIDYILINDLPTLVWVANIASIELHPFLHRAPEITVPTEIVFDFDPGEGADILTCVKVALLVRDVLEELSLKSFAKVSGSKGLQVYVLLNTGATYDVVKPFAKTLAELMEQRHPKLIVSKMSKSLRGGKVFIDWSQNTETKTTVSVYSLRAKSEQPYVSLPVTWEELKAAKDAKQLFFEPQEALDRLKKIGDLFQPIERLKQKLPADILSAAARSPSRTVNALETYRQKRDFSKTEEPPPAIPERSAQGSSTRRFVVQKHAASHLHYDFRLEMHGVLKSWAVPKGPPLSTSEKRLAMPTEDHPIDYLSFEGIIPKGQYGGGTVMVWDIGTYELMDGNYYKGYLKFFLSGKKLKGEWVLTRSREENGRPKWYLIKPGKPAHISQRENDRSALSGRTMEQITAKPERQWQSNRDDKSQSREITPAKTEVPGLDSLPKVQAKFIAPMLAEIVAEPPASADWEYEIKLDGYRAIAVKRDGAVDLYSRRANRMNAKYPAVAKALESLPSDTILDGEIVALDAEGRPDFNRLQNWQPPKPVYFYAFDILAYKGRKVAELPLSERRQVLEEALAGMDEPIRLSPSLDFPIKEIVRAVKQQGLEGIVAKRKDSRYEPGKRSGAWVKYKTRKGQELVVGGYIPGGDSFDSLLVGYYDGKRLIFIAKVRNGLTPALRRDVAKRFQGLGTDACPFANLPEPKTARRGKALTREMMKKCCWLKPALVAQIEFADWTEGDHLRHSKFVGFRDDKDPHEVRKESS